MITLSPWPSFATRWASAGRQSAGSSSTWAPAPASGQTAAFWPLPAPSSSPPAPYVRSHTPSPTAKRVVISRLD